MPGPLAAPSDVTPAQRAVQAALLRRAACPQALALRAKIILDAAGRRNEPLARQCAGTPKTVRQWRARRAAAAARLLAVDDDPAALAQAIAAALADAPRPGAPAAFTAEQIAQIGTLACRPPAQVGRPVAAWPPRELADAAVTQGIVGAISPRTVGRFLNGGRSPAAPRPLLAHRHGQG
jgi:putative transposase